MIAYQPGLQTATDFSSLFGSPKPHVFTRLDTGGVADKIILEECSRCCGSSLWAPVLIAAATYFVDILDIRAMKCQQCEKPATFHITELTGGKPQELHLCEDHARQYLSQSAGEPSAAGSMAAILAQQMAVGQTAEKLAQLDQQSCPVCGITFYEFRSQGRLGCPHDYVYFQESLDPLIMNIHGELTHVGKHPRKQAVGSEKRTQLIRLRRALKEAIDDENYELASKLRDDIRRAEKEEKT
jgi:protein arginine kinase activator